MLVVFALETAAGPASVKTQVRSHNADLGGDPRMVPRSGSIGIGFKPTSSFRAASSVTWPQVTAARFVGECGCDVCPHIYNMCFAHTDGLVLTRSFRVHTSTRPLTWLGGSSVRVPLTRTGPHTRTHSMPIKHMAGPTGQQSSSGFSDLAPSILHYNWF
jgi:hypothetical protein